MRTGRRRILALLALAAALHGCAGRTAPPSRVANRWPSGPQCLAALQARGVVVQAWASPGGGACRVDTPVVVARTGSLLRPALLTSCSMALAWASFECEVDRLARAELRSGLAGVRHFGSYSCRGMTGSAGQPSLHAGARALDVAAFELADGRVVTVKNDWSARGPEGRFLRAVAAAACRHFSATLTPATDRWHQDHLHLDIGPWRVCGV